LEVEPIWVFFYPEIRAGIPDESSDGSSRSNAESFRFSCCEEDYATLNVCARPEVSGRETDRRRTRTPRQDTYTQTQSERDTQRERQKSHTETEKRRHTQRQREETPTCSKTTQQLSTMAYVGHF